MPQRLFTCPHCGYQAPIQDFPVAESGTLKCRRCRTVFEDTNAYRPDRTYADCDSSRVVTRFPFDLDGRENVIHVPGGYLALLVGHDGQWAWLEGDELHLINRPQGFQLYYLCLRPTVRWGTRGIRSFGAYGSACLTVSKAYMKAACDRPARLKLLEEHFQELVIAHMTEFAQKETEHHNSAALERHDGYLKALGVIRDGVTLRRIDPAGYRTIDGHTGAILSYASRSESIGPLSPENRKKAPVEIIHPSVREYTVKDGAEDVILRGQNRTERHKAGERISLDGLSAAERILRFNRKSFEFPHGFGVYNLPSAYRGYFAAQGTISFYIDSTERLSLLMAKTDGWDSFTEHFFTNVIKKELSPALKTVINDFLERRGTGTDRLTGYLSSLSIALTNRLNGEDESSETPAFRRFGLRVRSADILSVDFYSDRR